MLRASAESVDTRREAFHLYEKKLACYKHFQKRMLPIIPHVISERGCEIKTTSL